MATVKVTRSSSLQRRRLGQQDTIQLIPTPYPFARKQSIKVTATFKVEPGPGSLFRKPRVETKVFNDMAFMEAIQAAQKLWPGASITVKTLGGTLTSPCAWCKKDQKESEMVLAGRGPDGQMRRVCKTHDDRVADLVKTDLMEQAS